jgi:hypothetical protein
MAVPSVTYNFVNGTPADADQVDTNFQDILNALTDGSKDLSINALTANDIYCDSLTAGSIVAVSTGLQLESLVADPAISNGRVYYNSVTATARVCQGGAYVNFSDNLGNHEATQNLDMGGYWLSYDGSGSGINVGSSSVTMITGGSTTCRLAFVDYASYYINTSSITGIMKMFSTNTLTLQGGTSTINLTGGSGLVTVSPYIDMTSAFGIEIKSTTGFTR